MPLLCSFLPVATWSSNFKGRWCTSNCVNCVLQIVTLLFFSFYLILGVAYIVVSLAVRIADAAVFDLFDDDITVSWPDGGPE